MLNRVISGAGTPGVPLVIAPGLFGSARNWGAISRRLADGRPVIAVDMRNHGHSPWKSRHDYRAMAADLAEVIGDAGGHADVLGHSMGGKAAMVLALTQPGAVRRLVVADIAPVAYGHSQTPLVDAMQALDPGHIGTRREADAALAVSVTDAATRAFLLQSLDLNADPPRWRLNLAVLRQHMPAIIGFPPLRAVFTNPALFLRGALSDYVRPEHAGLIAQYFPRATQAEIKGAGHWLHAEKPREFEHAVRRFLDA